MFNYDINEDTASKQYLQEIYLIEDISKQFDIQHCLELEQLCEKYNITYEFLEDLNKISFKCGDPIIISIVPKIYNASSFAIQTIKLGIDKLNIFINNTIPYIRFTFPEYYKNPHGTDYQSVFLFFIVNHKEEDPITRITYYLNKFNNLKAMI